MPSFASKVKKKKSQTSTSFTPIWATCNYSKDFSFHFVPCHIWIPLPAFEVNPTWSQHQLLLKLAPFSVNPINVLEPFELPSFSWALSLFGNQSAVLCAQLLLSKSFRRLAGIDHCHSGLLSPVVIMSTATLERHGPDSVSLRVPSDPRILHAEDPSPCSTQEHFYHHSLKYIRRV